ncbi:MAG: rRNA processing protein RimM [Candidatus Atribacteria bacterium]|nr:rRNA processing protein RimM [Candidatus Atribacteria bacterium]
MKRVLVGKILKAQGLEGMVKVFPLTDFAERFSPENFLWVGTPDEGYRLLTIEETTNQGKTLLIRFREVCSRQLAEEIEGCFLAVEEKELKRLPSDHFYHFELLGLKVMEKGELRGEVMTLIEGSAYDYLVVKNEEKEYYLPFIRVYVRGVDKERGVIEVECPGGFWD